MTCAAVLGVDACPMEGLSPAEYDRVLDLKRQWLCDGGACALGYRAATDKYAGLAKCGTRQKNLCSRFEREWPKSAGRER